MPDSTASSVPFPKKTLYDLPDVSGRTVLMRADLNVSREPDGSVQDTYRLRAVVPTLHWLLDHGTAVLLMSHLDRPGGKVDPEMRLDPVVDPLSEILDRPVRKASDCVGPSAEELAGSLDPGEVGLLENLRFHPGETAGDEAFARQLAALGDVYVNDAFGTAHRDHASVTGIPKFLKPAVAGELLRTEYVTLKTVADNPDRPLVALLGGAKLSGKLPAVRRFLRSADHVLLGGGMAFTFVVARGGEVGDSIVEREYVQEAGDLLGHLEDYRGTLTLPSDVTAEAPGNGEVEERPIDELPSGWRGMDIGPRTRSDFRERLEEASMVFWSGPMGVFEDERFAEGTRSLAHALAESSARVIVGGGDTAAAVHRFGLSDRYGHVSTGGGASVELVSGNPLPALEALEESPAPV